jgi:transcriptional regulator of acetoin/glycerol metabolism
LAPLTTLILTNLSSTVRVRPGRVAHPAGAQLAREFTELRAEVIAAAQRRSAGDITDGDLGRLTLRATLEDVLARHGGNKLAAARSLNMSRTTLYKRMQAFGLDSQ